MNRSKLKKILAALLAAAIAATAVLPVFASASEANSQKEEVVYVNLIMAALQRKSMWSIFSM